MSQQRHKKAIQAYFDIMMQPLAEGETGYCPPPTEMRDKKWAQILRGMWPEFRSVKITSKFDQSEAFNWCKENANFWYRAQNGYVYYFSDTTTACAFKLQYQGEFND